MESRLLKIAACSAMKKNADMTCMSTIFLMDLDSKFTARYQCTSHVSANFGSGSPGLKGSFLFDT